jgi:phage baseplate assembly protein W
MALNFNSRDFLGTGWSFPISVNARGGISMLAGEDDIESSIKMILLTAKGERVMRPEFGSSLNDHMFSPNSKSTHALVAHEIRNALEMWEPRVELNDILVSPHPDDPGCILIDIRYAVKATNDERNLVFPFYLIPANE